MKAMKKGGESDKEGEKFFYLFHHYILDQNHRDGSPNEGRFFTATLT
jgi:hypothetical protein